ncbi:MAG: methyltransferase domain-containing protein [Ignavibacteria bacterium]
MKPALLKYLQLPGCAHIPQLKVISLYDITLKDTEVKTLKSTGKDPEDYSCEIEKGLLYCDECNLYFPIINGIPRIYRGVENDINLEKLKAASNNLDGIKHQDKIRLSFSKEWDELNYDDNLIWLWTVDSRIDTFFEEIDVVNGDELEGKLMIDCGCGSGILAMNLAERYNIEIIAFDMADILDKAFRKNKSNLCHFVQTSVFYSPFKRKIADIVYSHGVLHHTFDTKQAFLSIEKLAKPNGLLYVWLYGKKKGWNRVRFIFIKTMRFIIARLPTRLQNFMVNVMLYIHLFVRAIKRKLGLEKVQYKTRSQLRVSIRDKYTPIYAREHKEDEVKEWFYEADYEQVTRKIKWDKTPWWNGSTDLSIKGIKKG